MERSAPAKEKVEKAIGEYNRYRVPEAEARLISFGEKSFEVEFTGYLCCTCGFYDYFDDFKILLEEIGLRVKIAEIKEIDEGAAVRFELLIV